MNTFYSISLKASRVPRRLRVEVVYQGELLDRGKRRDVRRDQTDTSSERRIAIVEEKKEGLQKNRNEDKTILLLL
jgi:hypothetical protein